MSFFFRIVAVARKEVRQLRRDRLTFGMIVGIPVMQLLLFGYAINLDVRNIPAGVANLSGTQRSRELIADAEATQVIDIVERVRSAEEIESLLRQGRISVGIVIPLDFERRLLHAERPPAHLLVDGGDPVVLAAASQLTSLPIANAFLPVRKNRRPLPMELRPYYNPERRSAVHIVPGLIGVILTMTMVLFTSVAIVRERERGNLEMLITTPVRTTELMVGKIVPYVIIGLIQVSLVLLLGIALFRVPIRGTIQDVYSVAIVFIAASLTLGLFISTLAQTQFQAFQMTFFTFLPQILLSGFMFPFDGMPRPVQLVAEILPLTHFVRLIRGILLRGATLDEVRQELWPLVVFFAVTFMLAIVRFRKRLD